MRSASGYALMPVVLTLVVVGVFGLLLVRQGALGGRLVAGSTEAEAARYVAEAGLRHAEWQSAAAGCAGDLALAPTPFGAHGYTATIDSAATTGVFEIQADRDGYLWENNPDSAFGGAANVRVESDPGTSAQAAYHFDVSTVPAGSSVTSATLWLYGIQTDDQEPVWVHAVTSAWAEATATWNNLATSFEPLALGAIPPQPTAGTLVAIDVTGLAQAWINDPSNNHGIMLVATSDAVQSRFASREFGQAALRPRLRIVTAVGDVSPLQLSATGTLASGATHTLVRSEVPARQITGGAVIQSADIEDTFIWTGMHADRNFGVSPVLKLEDVGKRNVLLRFELAALPPGAHVASATLDLYLEGGTGLLGGVIDAHSVSRSWVEGVEDDATPGFMAGATYNDYNGTGAWTTAGGDYDSPPLDSITIPSLTPGWYRWDVTSAVQSWLRGEVNYGLMVRASAGDVDKIEFTSSDSPTTSQRPRLSLTLACECGTPCSVPLASGKLLMVVRNDTNPDAEDRWKRALFAGWGYEVTLIDDNDAPSAFDTAFTTHDVVYVSETVTSGDVAFKLTATTLGVVSEEGELADELGIAAGFANPVGTSVDVIDTSHYITQPFTLGPLRLFSAGMSGLTVSGSEAPELRTLAAWSGAGGLVVLDDDAMLEGGGTAAGRRVQLPLAGGNDIDWRYLTGVGRTLIQRSIEWAKGAVVPGTQKLLFVASQAATLTAQENLKKAQIEAWGYLVEVIDEDDSQAAFDAAVAGNDVVFVTEDATSSDIGTKLTNAPIGVVIEETNLTDELGLATAVLGENGTSIEINDTTHYITQPLTLGPLTVLTSTEVLAYVVGPAPDLAELASSTSGFGVVALDAGELMFTGLPAAGRRAQLPWGGDNMDFAHLNSDGLTIFRRALEWGAGAANPVSDSILLTTETNATLGGLSFTDKDIAEYEPALDSATLFLDGASVGVDKDIDALHLLANGHVVLSTTDDVTLGGLSFHNEDLVDYDVVNDTATLLLEGAPLFSGGQDDISAVHVLPNGHFLLVNEYAAVLGGQAHENNDVIDYDPATDTATLFLDGDAVGLAEEISAVHLLPNGNLVLSADGPATLGGLAFDEGDLVEYDLGADLATLFFDGTLFSTPENIRAVHVGPGSGTSGGGGSGPCVASDDFESDDYSGSTGTVAWTGAWAEINESDGHTTGDEQVVQISGNHRGQVRDNNGGGEGLEREVDLSGYSTATLSLVYWRVGFDNPDDYVTLDVSDDGGATWTEIDRFVGPGTDASPVAVNRDISAFIASDTRLRLFTSPDLGSNDEFYFDDVEITLTGGSCP